MKRMPKNPEFAQRFKSLRLAFRLSLKGLARLAFPSGASEREIHNLYNRVRGWEVKQNEPAWSELAPIVHEIAAAYGPLADTDKNELVTMNWLLIGDPLPEWLVGRVAAPTSEAEDVRPLVLPPRPGRPAASSSSMAPAMPITLFANLSSVARRAAAAALREDGGRRDLEALETVTELEKWMRSLPAEQQARLTGPPPGDPPRTYWISARMGRTAPIVNHSRTTRLSSLLMIHKNLAA